MTSQKSKNIPLAIIGMGCFFARSNGLKEYWRLLFQGRDAISTVPDSHWSPDDYFHSDPKMPDHVYCRRGGFLPPIDFDPTEFGIPPNLLEATDTSQLLALVAAKNALEDAGYLEGKSFDRDRASVVLGATGTQELAIPLGARLGHPHWRRALDAAGVAKDKAELVIQHISDAYVPWQENSFPGLLGNVIAGRICNRLDLGGTNCVVDAACASSMSALHLAYMELVSNRSDLVLTGGVDLLNDIFMHMCFSKTQILSPTEDIRPFSKDADGTLLGEGVGILVLKRLEDAEKDNDNIYAVVKGMGTSSDGRSQSIYSPNTEGQEKSLRTAYSLSGIDPSTVELVEAHGTGTRVGDEVEFETLKRVFASNNGHRRWCALGSVKSMIGHTKAAAGSAGLIKSTLALHHKVLPPTLKAETPDPKLNITDSPFYLATKRRPWFSKSSHPRRCGVSAFGFGGSNFHVLLEEYQTEKQSVAWDGAVEILAVSGDSPIMLAEKIRELKTAVEKGLSTSELTVQLTKYRKAFSPTAYSRFLMVLTEQDISTNKIQGLLGEAARHLLDHPEKEMAPKLQAFYGHGETPGKLAFLFPGQGSQCVNMAEDVVCTFPEAFHAVENASRIFEAKWGQQEVPLSKAIYPLPANTDAEKKDQEALLRRTEYAQPAIGSISHGLLKVLSRFQVTPDACCGHSYGELTALLAAGWLTEEDFHALSVARGRCMSQTNETNGAMTAVLGPIDQLMDQLTEAGHHNLLANKNSPKQGVLSGPLDVIQTAENLCLQWGFKTKRLPVSNAFHSPLMAHAQDQFSKILANVTFLPNETPVFCNVTGSAYSKMDSEIKAALGSHLVSSVDFCTNLQGLYDAGVRTFLEVGPRAVLTGLVKENFSDKNIQAVSMDSSSGNGSAVFHLAKALCRLAALGYAVDLDQWETDQTPAPQKRMNIPITGANVKPRVTTPPKPKKEVRPEPTEPATPSQPAPPSVQPPNAVKTNLKQNNSQTGISNIMDKGTSSDAVAKALQVAEQGLKSMQTLQQQTAEAHQKFLETQSEATKALTEMIANAQRMTGVVTGMTPAQPFPKASPPSLPKMELPDPVPTTQPEVISQPITSMPSPSVSTTWAADPMPKEVSKPTDTKLSETLLSVVSRLTGYPEEMLGLDMDIESDLGIDSIKRVEILSALEEEVPGLPDVPPDVMGSLKTLGQIIQHLSNASVDGGQPASTPTSDITPATPQAPSGALQTTLLSVVSRLTGYPEEMLGLDMDIESDLGIDSIKRVEILSALEEEVPGLPDVPPDVMGSLKTLGQIIDHLSKKQTAVASTAPATSAASSTQTGHFPKENLQSTLLSVVSRLTGYPEEMLGLDMDIESDLGIDSIKRVEILSALEEEVPGLPDVPPDVMGSLKTLGQIISHLSENDATRPQVSSQADSLPSKNADIPSAPISETLVARQEISVFPLPELTKDSKSLDLKKTVYITPGDTDLSKALVEEFKSRGMDAVLLPWQEVSKIRSGKVTLKSACGLVLLAPASSKDNAELETTVLEDAFTLAKQAGPSLIEAAKTDEALLATVTFLDGAFGFGGKPFGNPAMGGLAGLAKTAALEWPEVCCRAIDIDPAWSDTSAIAKKLVSELLNWKPTDPVEIGLCKNKRITLQLENKPLQAQTLPQLNATSDDVFVITGGARGVTAETAKTLAKTVKPILLLLGRSPEPVSEPGWLSSLSDEAAIKKAILTHEFDGKAPKPIDIESSYKRHMANREILGTLEQIRSIGGQVYYYSVDIRNLDETAKIINTVRSTLGPIKGIIHGAGVLEDRFILDKTEEQFRRVLDTKIKGLQNLLTVTADDALSYLILFSSVAARVGNQGQVDYAMANEVLNKLAQQQALRNSACRVLSMNWGPWAGGMVNDSLKREFERKGISLIPLEAGAACLINEMGQQNNSTVEIVIGATMQETVVVAPPTAHDTDASVTRMISKQDPLQVMLNRDIDLRSYPILKDHQLDGIPVVPFALLTEWLGHTALHDNPGLLLQGVDDMRLLKGIRMDSGKKMIRLLAGKLRKNGSNFEVDVEIRNGVKDVKEVLHTKARAILTDRLPAPPDFDASKITSFTPYERPIEEVYEKILFHGHALHGLTNIHGLSEKGMSSDVAPAPPPESWVAHPMRSRWIGDPLVLDSAFQMACVWCYEQSEMVSLPSYIASYRQYCRIFPDTGITAILEISDVSNHKMTGDFTFLDADQQVVAQLKGYEAVMDMSLYRSFKPQFAVNE